MKHTDLSALTVLAPADSKVMVDAFMAPLLSERIEQARRINPHYETLWQDVQTLYTAGGKRLRSYMTLLTFSAFSDAPISTILPAAVAQELLHTAMLIHDDIIDRDDIRYGVKNIGRSYQDHYEELIPDEADRRHYASSAAILAGDLLISEAYALLSETEVDAKAVLASQKLLGRAIFQVVGGELLDTEAAFRGADAAGPLVIAEQKTASYSFVSPLLMGATLASAEIAQLELLQRFGEQLGIAYQLRDDLLGMFGDSDTTGKSVDGDLKEGKRTLLIDEFYLRADEADKEVFNGLFGRHDLTDEDCETLRLLLVRSGAKAAVEAEIEGSRSHVLHILDALTMSDEHRHAYLALINACLNRAK
jgi:geranylgeranyl diphosphate synthase type I